MGICSSSPEENQSKVIEDQLAEERRRLEKLNVIKLLLLGTGESGKSTVLKQFRLLHGEAWAPSEISAFRSAVLSNLLGGAKTLVEAMDELQIEWGSQRAKITALQYKTLSVSNLIMSAPNTYGEGNFVSSDVLEAIQIIWKDEGIQLCFSRSNEYQLMDSCRYYMEEAPRLCHPTYIPQNQDILRTRVMTTTITENNFKIGSKNFRIFDVGGQRSERKKWAPYFDDCSAIIFVSAISAFDQTCFED
ncbi:guanine nucleotide-binding protein subunit alpha, partial [Nowakowskiella sp. JEL0078]